MKECNILLSIIIPTKNRQFTCLYAIESALNIGYNDIEIVVQDCSDTNLLEYQILKKFGNDTRIKYFFDSSYPSMTDNWNRAFERSIGEFVCAIGDDDAVLTNIYSACIFAKDKAFKVLTQPDPCSYKWPDFGGYEAGTLTIFRNVSGDIYKYKTEEALGSITKVDTSYGFLPMLYHCLVSRELLDELKLKTGKLLDGTSLDAYSAYALSIVLPEYSKIDLPYSIRGACGKSNTNKVVKHKDNKSHFSDYKEFEIPSLLPPIMSTEVSIAESAIKAFINMQRMDLINLINLPYVYAYSALKDYKSTKIVFGFMLKNNATISDWIKTMAYFCLKSLKIVTRIFLEKSKILPIIHKVFFKYKVHRFENILQAVQFYEALILSKK